MSGCGKGCGFNAGDPNAPEFNKGYKIQSVSQLGCGINIDVVKLEEPILEKTVIRQQKTREDFIN